MHFNLLKYFEFVSAATLDDTKIKKDEIIKEAINSLNIKDMSKVVMVGDRKHDIIGAKNNGIASIGALWGYGSLEELQKAGATHIINNPTEILNYIK